MFVTHRWRFFIKYMKLDTADLKPKIVSEYDQEIPQSQTTDKPVASLGRAAQQSRDTLKTTKAKQPALAWLIEMIANQEWTQSNAPKKHRTITESNNESNNQQQQNHRLRMDSSQSHWDGGMG